MLTKFLNLIILFLFTFVISSLFTGCTTNKNNVNKDSSFSSDARNIKIFSNVNSKEKMYNIKIPVLMYHYIRNENTVNELIVSTKNFEKQMSYLKENNYKTLSLDELYTILKTKQNPYEKSVVITFDDGYTDNYIHAYPILKKYGQAATIFVISGRLDVKPDYFMTTSNIIELESNGVNIENHTENHDKLASLSYDQQLQTIENGRKGLQTKLEKPIKYFAYPFGSYNSDTIKALKATHHFMSFTTKKGYVTEKSDLFQLNRFMIFQDTNLEHFKNIVNGTCY